MTLKLAPVVCLYNGSKLLVLLFVLTAAPKVVNCSTVWWVPVPQAFSARSLFAFLFTRVHIRIIRDLVQTTQGHDYSVVCWGFFLFFFGGGGVCVM